MVAAMAARSESSWTSAEVIDLGTPMLSRHHTLSHVVALRTPGRRGLKQRWWTTKRRRHSELRPKQATGWLDFWPQSGSANYGPTDIHSGVTTSPPPRMLDLSLTYLPLLTEPMSRQDSNIGGEDDHNNNGNEDFNRSSVYLPSAEFSFSLVLAHAAELLRLRQHHRHFWASMLGWAVLANHSRWASWIAQGFRPSSTPGVILCGTSPPLPAISASISHLILASIYRWPPQWLLDCTRHHVQLGCQYIFWQQQFLFHVMGIFTQACLAYWYSEHLSNISSLVITSCFLLQWQLLCTHASSSLADVHISDFPSQVWGPSFILPFRLSSVVLGALEWSQQLPLTMYGHANSP